MIYEHKQLTERRQVTALQSVDKIAAEVFASNLYCFLQRTSYESKQLNENSVAFQLASGSHVEAPNQSYGEAELMLAQQLMHQS